ncbi:Myb-like DNA-binding domain containing protein [Tritrichomonas foetus]|uniref:Myb-like DNA-binding domain containing protein n=1 Tax=Tritrichomonas foetus TaxID=1144522 RepID=A0A1J4KKP8_9EUKA|nr:Myb-like DNA-binding domain containing protein [Tritrichomonas foetus]|eukprot:OHT11803.1 Myb-like DNA-binding domain containing protein [Tritrichomonas foetus]
MIRESQKKFSWKLLKEIVYSLISVNHFKRINFKAYSIKSRSHDITFYSLAMELSATACEYTHEGATEKVHRRHKFTKEEDQRIVDFFENHGPNWKKMAKLFDGLTPRQLRGRYTQYLDPSVKNTPWTKEEEDLLLKCQELYGNTWSVIVKKFPCRSPANLKNQWLKIQRRNIINDRSKNNDFSEIDAVNPYLSTESTDDDDLEAWCHEISGTEW